MSILLAWQPDPQGPPETGMPAKRTLSEPAAERHGPGHPPHNDRPPRFGTGGFAWRCSRRPGRYWRPQTAAGTSPQDGPRPEMRADRARSEEHTSELQSRGQI